MEKDNRRIVILASAVVGAVLGTYLLLRAGRDGRRRVAVPVTCYEITEEDHLRREKRMATESIEADALSSHTRPMRQSCLVVSLIVSLGIHIVGGVARSLGRTTSHTQKQKVFGLGGGEEAYGPQKMNRSRLKPQVFSARPGGDKP